TRWAGGIASSLVCVSTPCFSPPRTVYSTCSFRVAHSSSGQGHRPLKAETTGSNPVCATSCNRIGRELPFTWVSGNSLPFAFSVNRDDDERWKDPPQIVGIRDPYSTAVLTRTPGNRRVEDVTRSNSSAENARPTRRVDVDRCDRNPR